MIFLLLCLIFFIPNDVAPACPTGWTLDAGHCYMWDTTRTARNFSKATEFCQSNNGYVVNIETYEENDFLRNYTLDSLGSLEYIWLGITYLEENGRWRWYITNHTAYYTNWYQSPVNITDNCSVAHVNGSDLEWFVSPCNDSHFTICEKGEHCPAGWDGYYEGSCYYMDSYYMDSFYNDYYHHRRRNFFEAVEFCQNMSGHVITLETSEESDSFYNYTRRLRYHYHIYDTWFGVTNIGANETWRWYNTNENAIYTNWNPGQPDQDPHKNCSFFLIYHDMVWYSEDCRYTTGMTICEKDIGYISPVFAREHYYFYQDEDIPVGATVGIVAATHIETGTSGDIVYSIAEGDVDSKFDIEQTSGALILMAELDFETATVNPYVIVVHAKKNDSAYFQTWTASVILPINDVNDNAPVCEPVTEALTVYENVTPPVDIAHLSCTDHDSLDNAVLTFTITHANHIASMFAITKSGIISLVQSVDFETKTGHEVIIHVEDGGTASFTTTVNLTVTVLDVNDGKPMFELSTYQKFVSESEPAGSTVLTMTVTDTDVADTTFTFNIDSGNVDNIFDVSGNTEIANLIINDTSFLNYETTRNYNLVLRASDIGGLFSTTSVNISITNYNEHFPVVVSSIPSPVHVAENVPSGHVVAVIEATDADHGDAGEVTYTVVSGTNNQFAIDTKSGIVTSTISLDRESISSYEITVNITDGGTIPGALTSKFTLLVNVTDVNDIAPVCRSLNGASVPADAPPGTIVAQLDCTDGDATPPYNMISTYAITRGNVGVAFVMSRIGEVKTAKQLDIEILDNYFLEINVSDAGPTPLQTTTTLAITVLGQLTFAYGIEARDSFLQTGNGGLSGKITTSYGIPISDGLYYTIYICKDGLISLGEPYCNPTPSANLSSLHGRTVISPYHASIKLQESSNVSFRWFDIHNISSTYDKDKALDLMEMFIEDDNFQPAFILIVTWINVVPLRTDVRPGEMATFQLLLLSDGFTTFTSFQYARGQMNWLPRKHEQTYIRIGYNFPGYSYTHLSSFTQSAFRTDKLTEINGQSGLLFYRLTNNDNPIRNDAMTCLIWYYGNVGLQENMYSLVPRCPCNTERLRFDPSFRGLFNDGSIHRNTECFVSWPSSILGTSGTTCCYDSETGLFISQRPRSGGFIQYHPFLEPVKHDIYDKRIKEQCCVYSNLCDFYYGLRPDSDCYTDTRFRQSTFWGDPHFQTLDGYDFTYNGLGEYILLQIDDGDIFFTIQARTIQALDVDGMGVNATVFGAFAARDNSGAALHVELDASKTGLIIYGNDKDLTKQLEDEPVYVDSEQQNMCLMRYNDSLDAYFSLTQTLMTITVSNAMLDLRLVVAETFSGNTRGLLGNYDENSENDIVLRNGSFVSLDPTGKEINSFGQSWRINMSESAFKYEQGKNTSDYTDINFNWSAQNILANISADEGSCEDNSQCIFDLMLTRNENLTQHTKAVSEFATYVREKLDNSVPSVQGCDLITNARLGEFVTCRITMRDDKDNTSIVVKQSSAFANISITYADETTTTADLVIQVDEHLLENDISVVAIDVEGESSSPIVINLLICNNCNGHGHCDLGNARRDKSNSDKASLLAACICEPYWTGKDCETDFDGCAASPCSHGRTCADKTAFYHSATGVSYTCDPCPSGYIDNGSACIDDDECVYTNGGCGQECINTDGSYVCLCLSGYRADNNLCIDINECDEDLHDCKHICSNIDGGYNCSCHPGYQLNSDLQECVLITDDNPCSEKCLDADGCIYLEDETSCFCNAGFSLTENETCIDTNECDSNVCQQGCTNGPGNYTCFCYSGYILEADNTCIRCNDTHWGPDCVEECRCTDMGAAKCDPVIGCICKTGWEGIVCETDVDECVTIPNVCDPDQRCVNQPGSYQCVCRDGFIKDEEGKCVDINECGQKAINNCTGIQLCRNTNGGYICECKKGYTADMNGGCRDIDECLSEVSHCEQLCENVAGQYNCYCIYGYRLNQDRQTCVKDPRATDICQTYNMSCSQLCLRKDGNTTCGCRLGYKLALDKTSCIDIDECASEKTNLCSDRDTCRNTEGGYTCACAAGYKLGRDNRTCIGCDKYHFGPNCIHECDCGPGSSRCDPLLGCRCNPGWMGAQCDTDRDECAVLQNPCMGDHQECINTPGAFRCRCKFGYVNTSDHGCEDSDECEHQTKHHCDQLCVNTDRSYRCDCRPGFIRSGSKCQDIDECVGQHGCAHSCVNTLGGYRCSCKSGFKLDLENRRACLPKLLCENTTCTNGTCVIHDNGTEDCVCNKGFVMVDGVCSDVDECEARPCASECNNLLGGYRCTCPVGSKLDVDNSSCVGCGSGMYGAECADMCDCTADRTTSCDPVNGTCVCMAGWTGARCNVDIDECEQAECPTSSECINTNGSRICQCLTGFFKTSSGLCQPCDRTHYGQNCEAECMCKEANTITCDNNKGTCTCLDGWQGDDCNTDVNECEEDVHSCRNAHQMCNNINGSFVCTCESGYKEIGEKCIDINECLENEDTNCLYNCTNTDGSYECMCPLGMEGHWNDCYDCSRPNTYGMNCSSICPCEQNNTISTGQSCDPISGQCICLSTWTGARCEEDVNECALDTHNCTNYPNTGCRNVLGGFYCDCLRGYVYSHSACIVDDIPVEEDSIPAHKTMVPMQLTIVNPLDAGTSLQVTSVYTAVKTDIETMLLYTYKPFAVKIQELEIRDSSLLALYDILCNTTEGDIGQALVRSASIMSSKQLELTGQIVNVTNILYIDTSGRSVKLTDNASLCVAFEDLYNCSGDHECIISSQKPTCIKTETREIHVFIIIGIAGASVVFLFMIVTVALCIRNGRRTSKNANDRRHRSPDDGFDVAITGNVGETSPSSHSSPQQESANLTWRTQLSKADKLFQIKRPKIEFKPNPMWK